MTLNSAMAVILFFTEFGSFSAALHKSGWRCRWKKVHVHYLISRWVSGLSAHQFTNSKVAIQEVFRGFLIKSFRTLNCC